MPFINGPEGFLISTLLSLGREDEAFRVIRFWMISFFDIMDSGLYEMNKALKPGEWLKCSNGYVTENLVKLKDEESRKTFPGIDPVKLRSGISMQYRPFIPALIAIKVCWIIDLEEREMDYQNFKEALRTDDEKLGCLKTCYPDIIENIILMILGKNEELFKNDFNQIEQQKQELTSYVESCQFLRNYFEDEEDLKKLHPPLMNIVIEDPDCDEHVRVQSEFQIFSEYFRRLFIKKPKAREIIRRIVYSKSWRND